MRTRTPLRTFVLPAPIYHVAGGLLSLAAAAVAQATAQWSFVDLHPSPSIVDSWGYAISGGQQGGWTYPTGFSGGPRACMWTGQASTFVNLHPRGVPSYYYSQVIGVGGGQQVGYVNFSGSPCCRHQACIWNGTSESLTYLMPPGIDNATAYATDGVQQAGYIVGVGAGSAQTHAAMWSGTAASMLDLTPDADFARAFAIGDGQQGGEVRVPPGYTHAALWTGSPASFVDLNPGPAAQTSVVWGVGSGQQVGSVLDGVSGTLQAVLWSGTPESAVFLNPFVPTSHPACEAYGVGSGYQVGYVEVTAAGGSVRHASIWRGTAASWFDLHTVLGNGYISSAAYGVTTDPSHVYVTGVASGPVTAGANHAILWTLPLCAADFNGSGTITVQDIFDFLAAYFGGDTRADINVSGTITVQDIFDFLAAYFAGCL